MLYTTFLYAVVLLFLGITYMAQLQVLKGKISFEETTFQAMERRPDPDVVPTVTVA